MTAVSLSRLSAWFFHGPPLAGRVRRRETMAAATAAWLSSGSYPVGFARRGRTRPGSRATLLASLVRDKLGPGAAMTIP